MQVYRAIALLFKPGLKPKIFYLIQSLDPKKESDPTEYPDCLLKKYVFNLSKLHILSHFSHCSRCNKIQISPVNQFGNKI